MPKTNAEICRDYYRRKKAAQNKLKKIPLSSTERVRNYRARKKSIKGDGYDSQTSQQLASEIQEIADVTCREPEYWHPNSAGTCERIDDNKCSDVDGGITIGNKHDIKYSKEYNQQFLNNTNSINEKVGQEKIDNNKIFVKEELHDEDEEYFEPFSVFINQKEENEMINLAMVKNEIEIKEECADEDGQKIHQLIDEEQTCKGYVEEFNGRLKNENIEVDQAFQNVDLGNCVAGYSKSSSIEDPAKSPADSERNSHRKPSKIYKCFHCNFRTKYKTSLRSHVKNVHLDQNGLECADTANDSTEKQTTIIHPTIGQYKCDFCDYKATYKPFIKSHVEAVHLDVKKYTCEHCSFETDRKSTMENHIDGVHLKLKKHKCTRCDYGTYHYPSLKRHIDVTHQDELIDDTFGLNATSYKCARCDFVAGSYAIVQNHNDKVHLGIESFDCEHCDFKAFCRATVKAHTDIFHEKVEKLKCEYCDYKSHFVNCIQRHVKTAHRKIKSEKCDVTS